MLVDCDRCEVRDIACGNCVIGVLLRTPEEDRPVPYLPVDLPDPQVGPPLSGHTLSGNTGPGHAAFELAEPERRALDVLADQGLIPRLRMVPERAAG